MTSLLGKPVVGLMITAPGFAATRELYRLLPPNLDAVVTTALLTEVSPVGIVSYWQMLDYVLDQVASAKPSYVLQNTVVIGLTGDLKDLNRLRDRIGSHTGAQVILSVQAVVDTLREDQIRHPLVVMPYMQALRDRLGAIFAANGIQASGWIGPQMRSPGDIHRGGASAVTDLIRAGVAEAGPDCDAVLISGGGWSSLDLIDPLQAELSLPVLTSNVAQARQLARLSGHPLRDWRAGQVS
jgi:maleate isomerase